MGAGRAFGDYLKSKKISVSEVSEISGVKQQTIYSFINRDSNRIDINDFIRMCEAVGVRPEFFADSFEEHAVDSYCLTLDEQELLLLYREMKQRQSTERLAKYMELFRMITDEERKGEDT